MTVSVLERSPSTLSVFSRAFLTMAKRGRKPVLPELSLVLERARTDRAQLAAYNEVCGFASGAHVPVLWPHMLAFPLRMALMSDARFPFPLPGLVHIKNRTYQWRGISADDVLRLECSLGSTQPHEKGVTFTLISEAKIGGERVWRDESTLLHRSRTGTGAAARDDEDQPVESSQDQVAWSLAEDLGRRYARASGDWNPIHLHPLSARAFGFKRAIAHGMWSAAHGLAALPGYDPSGPLTYSAWFKLPVFLPSQVVYRRERVARVGQVAEGARFEVRDNAGQKPHVRGLLVPGVPSLA